MSYAVTTSDPSWTFDGTDIERQVAAIAKANGITGQAQWTTFIAGLTTLAQALAVCRGLLSAVKTNTP